MALEDTVNVPQRPKAEVFNGHMFITLRMVVMGADSELTSEQISIFFDDKVLVTFQQQKDDCFGPVRERIRHGRGRIRTMGPDYLAYALIDAILDNYLPVLDMYAEILDEIELSVMDGAAQETISRIHNIRRDLTALRRPISPLREAISVLLQEDMPYVGKETHVFFRDLHDHTVRAIDMIENYRELTGNLMDFHLSMMSHRMNEVMKMLTIISTIFIPLGFVAGLYGMNFNSEVSPYNMPELDWYWGYPTVVGVMVTIAVGLLIYFRRKRWI
ncbi:MAG: magnesium/cobalt transporter CorA [Candidatus Poribacteria bacterium]|nr:magnesium/cobalt transporter CorA [Candidatus Poribacteria bacterium]